MASFIHVIQNIERISKDRVESMKGFSTATVCKPMVEKGAFPHSIKPIGRG
jgi:hypothetical protein